MAIAHNQINLFWSKPTYDNFKKSFFVKKIYTDQDADLFLRVGAHLIVEAQKLSDILIPWDDRRKFEILQNPILENAFFSLGSEYLMKGVFLKQGYAINKPKVSGLAQPVPIKNNKNKLIESDFHTINYITDHIGVIINFSDFNTKQQQEELAEKAQNKGQRLDGITKMGIPHPTARQFLDYIKLKRNHSLHKPTIISEFRGITKQLFEFLEYIAQKGAGSSIEVLSKL